MTLTERKTWRRTYDGRTLGWAIAHAHGLPFPPRIVQVVITETERT